MRRFSRTLVAAAAALTFGAALPLAAEQRPVVVELYTSQGCSSCPPADAMLAELRERSDVIAIALHVDYWDYIGWQDEFGHPAHAERQRAYAAKAGRRSVFTPEMIVNGQTDIVGAKPMKLSKAIADHMKKAPRITLDAERDGRTIALRSTVPSGAVAPMEVHVLHLHPSHTSKITRGENRGKTYEYTNIAHDWRVAGTWDGASPLDMTVQVAGDDPVVVLIQEAGAGAIVGAARVD